MSNLVKKCQRSNCNTWLYHAQTNGGIDGSNDGSIVLLIWPTPNRWRMPLPSNA